MTAKSKRGPHLFLPAWAAALSEYTGRATDDEAIAETIEATGLASWHLLLDEECMLHPTYKAADAGRLYASHPAIQTLPKELRVAVYSPNRRVLTADWCAAHLRLLANASGDAKLLADLNSADVYELARADVKMERSDIKRQVSARLNGGGPSKVDQALIDWLERRWPTALRYLHEQVDKAKKISNRTRPELAAEWLQGREAKALMQVLQWVAETDGIDIMIPMHDGVVVSVEVGKLKELQKRMSDVMLEAIEAQGVDPERVVKFTSGPTWGPGNVIPQHHARSRWVALGLAALQLQEDEKSKDLPRRILGDPFTRMCVEIALVHARSRCDTALEHLRAMPGGRDAAAALRRLGHSIRGAHVRAAVSADAAEGLSRGDHVELAQVVLESQGAYREGAPTGTWIADLDAVWKCNTQGLWEMTEPAELRRLVTALAGTPIGSKGKTLHLRETDITGTVRVIHDLLARPHFFHETHGGAVFNDGVLVEACGNARRVTPADRVRVTDVLAIPYVPDADATEWMAALDRVYLGDARSILRLREFVGVAMLGLTSVFQRALLLVGDGRNGKSTVVETISRMWPRESVAAVTPHDLSGGKREYYLAALADAKLCVCSEMPSGGLHESRAIKATITGDEQTARRPYGQPFTVRPRAAWLISANELPQVKDASDGFWRRFMVLPHRARFEDSNRDVNISTKLQAELPGIAAWALAAGLAVVKRGAYTEAQVGQAEMEQWRQETDTIAAFVSMLQPTGLGQAQTWSADLYKSYVEWTQETNAGRPVSLQVFGRRLKQYGFTASKSNGKMRYWAVLSPEKGWN